MFKPLNDTALAELNRLTDFTNACERRAMTSTYGRNAQSFPYRQIYRDKATGGFYFRAGVRGQTRFDITGYDILNIGAETFIFTARKED